MKVRNNDVRLYTLGGGKLNLTPGVNAVDDNLWLECTATPGPALAFLLKTKVLEVLEAPKGAAKSEPEGDDQGDAGEPSTKTGDDSLAGLKADEAIALVADTLDRDTLEAWRQGEKRKTVLEAIDEQIELTKV